MQNTTNYNFNLPEGTDLWNYLTQTNPNFTALDSILKGVSDATVTTATEVASGTAHAISRTLPDANVIRFTATSNWTLGDTMTIDGTPVTVVKPNGTNLQTGDYVIGSEVLGVIRATQFTVYVGGASSLDAADVTFDNDNTHPWLTANDVEDAIKETATEVDTINSNLAGLRPQLLWTNPTPASAFATQQVTLSSGDYDAYQVYFNEYSNGMTCQLKGESLVQGYNSASGGNPINFTRVITYVDSTHLTFSNVKRNNVDDTNVNALIVPLRIYGIKF